MDRHNLQKGQHGSSQTRLQIEGLCPYFQDQLYDRDKATGFGLNPAFVAQADYRQPRSLTVIW